MTNTIPTATRVLKNVTLRLTEPVSIPAQPPVTEFGVARTHREVLDCWRLVYNCYTSTGLIDANPYELHTSAQAIKPGTTVIYGRTQGVIDSTLSVIPDGDRG